MAKIDLGPLPPFDPHGDPSSWWKIWTKHFQTYIVAMKITNDKQKRVLPLAISGRRSNTRNISKVAWNWGRLRYSTSQTRWVFFSQEKCWLPSISILLSSPAVRQNCGSICHEVVKASSNLWILWFGKRNKVSGNSELPLQTITTICVRRRHTYVPLII